MARMGSKKRRKKRAINRGRRAKDRKSTGERRAYGKKQQKKRARM